MRLVYREPVIRTVSDDEIADDSRIHELLTQFKDDQQTLAIIFDDPDFPENTKNVETGRIELVAENTFDLYAMFPKSAARYKRIPFHHIRSISLIASKQAIAKKYRVNRWHLLDVADVDA
jgi:ABC-type amino acid transport substrate-binding protein